ncbi:MAG: hypothetical protein WCI73_16840 [Phycisphaerae bacterium]
MKRGRKPICPYCGGKRSRAKGHRVTVTLGLRSLRLCQDCGRKFTVGRSPAKRASAPRRKVVPNPNTTVELPPMVRSA